MRAAGERAGEQERGGGRGASEGGGGASSGAAAFASAPTAPAAAGTTADPAPFAPPSHPPARKRAAGAASGAGEALAVPVVGRDEGGLFLTDGVLELRAGFSHLSRRIRPGALQRELVVRAARVKSAACPVRVLDATAGLGEDAFLLAAAGCEVDLYERDPAIAALLSDALARARTDPALREAALRMRLHEQDSIPALAALSSPPDVVLLDPMFPAREKSAAVKKKFQLLQRLEKPCDDEAALLGAACAARPKKVVVKRPAKGPALAGSTPDYSISGKAIRYDCYIPA